MEGIPVKGVQRLCNVHSAVFKGSIEEIHGKDSKTSILGHSLNTFKRENDKIKQFLGVKFRFHIDLFTENDKLIKDLNILYEIDKHYLRKENLLFPFLDKYGIYGPPKVMWGVDDEIRILIKEAIENLKDNKKTKTVIIEELEYLIIQISEMIFKEENILFTMAEDTLTQDEWLKIQDESNELGYTLIDKPVKWNPPKLIDDIDNEETKINNFDGNIHFETGVVSIKELELLLNHLPFDITFIDKDDVVKYFSHGKERIFPRTKAVIGRTVQNCHPPGSVHVVNDILNDFRNGIKEHEDFWIKMHGLYIFIRYFAVRNEEGEYIGVLK